MIAVINIEKEKNKEKRKKRGQKVETGKKC